MTENFEGLAPCTAAPAFVLVCSELQVVFTGSFPELAAVLVVYAYMWSRQRNILVVSGPRMRFP